MSEKTYTIKMTEGEIREITDLIANGVCDFEAEGNEVAKSAKDKLYAARLKTRKGATPQ